MFIFIDASGPTQLPSFVPVGDHKKPQTGPVSTIVEAGGKVTTIKKVSKLGVPKWFPDRRIDAKYEGRPS
jgi:hypothetical protein